MGWTCRPSGRATRGLKYLGAAIVAALFIASAVISKPKGFCAFRGHRIELEAGLNQHRSSLRNIHNSTLGFEKVLAINLPERKDRRLGLERAAKLFNLDVVWINGVSGEDVDSPAHPVRHSRRMTPPQLGSWHAHLAAIKTVVENEWASALILEDDIDWDVRLRSLLQDFAIASVAILSDPATKQLDFEALLPQFPHDSPPYGDSWDVLWLGHCGMEISDTSSIVVHSNDSSVPALRHIKSWSPDTTSPLARFPPHTRIVAQQREGVCSLAYAVSRSGAIDLLQKLTSSPPTAPFDIGLRSWCDGQRGATPPKCISTLPQLFDHHRPAGSTASDSDISVHEGGYRFSSYTQNIRWSVRMNMDRIQTGDSQFVDQWPDNGPHVRR